MTEKLMIEHAQIEPLVTLSFDENWITFTLRYVVDFKKRRGTKDLIFTKALESIRNSDDKIKLAASTLEVTTIINK